MGWVVPAVLAGGVTGAAVRWGVGEAGWSTSITLLVVNTLGCVILGVVVHRLADHRHPARLALGLGVCGGLTTFSGLTVELAARLDEGNLAGAVLLLALSIGAGVAAFRAGRAVA